MENEKVIKQVQEYMREHNLNQVELAVKLGIAHSQLNRWLKTKRISKAWIALLENKKIIS